MVELEGSQPIINTPSYLAWHPKGILEIEQFQPVGCMKTGRGYEEISGHDEPLKSWGSMNAWEECVTNHTHCRDL